MALDSTLNSELTEKGTFYTNHPAIALIRECKLTLEM